MKLIAILNNCWRRFLPTLPVLFVHAVMAQGVFYGSPQPPAYYAAGFVGSYDLDVNGDGIADFVLISEADSALIQPLGSNSLITIPEPPSDLGYLVAALPSGFTVGSSLDPIYQWYYPNTDQFGMAAIGAQEDAGAITYFLNKTAYAGFDLYYDGADHYGWMQIANPYGVVAGQVLGWAYESDPNTPITTGEVPEPSIVALLSLYALTFWLACRCRRTISSVSIRQLDEWLLAGCKRSDQRHQDEHVFRVAGFDHGQSILPHCRHPAMKIGFLLLLALNPLCALAQGVVYLPSPSIPGQYPPFNQYGVSIGTYSPDVQTYAIDINGDGIVDYTLSVQNNIFNIIPAGSNSVLSVALDNYGDAGVAPLGAGIVIDSLTPLPPALSGAIRAMS